MPIIELATHINAPIEKCFDVARSIDVHVASTWQTGETAIAGRTSGLIELGESVTWRAKHFGIWQTLTSKVTEMEYPNYFVDEMVKGAFKSFRHEHYFYPIKDQTLMKDIFMFESPVGLLGMAANFFFLKDYMKKLLEQRNMVIKETAERKG
ncbi:Ligand-binding SRPBCC domain-containing protein [Mucilaginibacter pineti]|uniref:Ligand-binding SRPBCC domain-containing protein n=1 Tax=Mucilaginibacter pineti TaxID=1391627 RepID=A0A1G7D3A9_9SPHI|nr:SRPBCC family protein [Mucilaginibacter pineti]SDE46082.1 Ligand-binding SRPBCC domain-containing protein [Mucilaginibacter pineti]